MGKLRNDWKKAKVGYVNKVGSRLLSVDDNRGDFKLNKDLGPKLDDVEIAGFLTWSSSAHAPKDTIRRRQSCIELDAIAFTHLIPEKRGIGIH